MAVGGPAGAAIAVWSGTEVILWDGEAGGGGRYDPVTDAWAAMASEGAPPSEAGHTAVWTGSEMIVWGGNLRMADWPPPAINGGGRYSLATDTWTATRIMGAPEPRMVHSAVWAGNEMIVWGGATLEDPFPFDDGGRYDPVTDAWEVPTTTAAPEGRRGHTAVWTGSEMIVWGGIDHSSGFMFSTGGRYNPSRDTWNATSTADAPTVRTGHTAVWTGSEMIVWGGVGIGSNLASGGRYDPSTDTWEPVTMAEAPAARLEHTAVWTGEEMIVWGGLAKSGWLATGGRYDPTMDSWTPIPVADAPPALAYPAAVWTGEEMIVWGMSGGGTGGRYRP